MSNPSHVNDHKDLFRADGATTRIIDSEVLLKKVFDEDPRQGCAMLFRLYYSPLFSHAVRFVYSKAAAEDIVAEVFCRFWEERIFDKINTSYRGYLFKAVRHRAYNYVKFELARKTRRQEHLSPSPAAPDNVLEYDELYQFLEDAIDKLPQQCKKVFLLSRMEDKKYHDIAEEMGVSVKAIEGHITRALRILRKKLAGS